MVVILLLVFSLVLVGFSTPLGNSERHQSSLSNDGDENNKEDYSLNISTGRVGFFYDSPDRDIVPDRAGTTDPEPGEHEISPASEVTVSAISGENWKFSHWSGDIQDDQNEEKEITITMTRNKNLTAHFRILEENEYLGTEKNRYEPGEDVIIEVKNDGSASSIPIINVFQIQIQNVDTGDVVYGPLTGVTMPAVPDYGKTEYFVWNQTGPDRKQVSEGNYIVKSEYDDWFNHTAEFQISKVPPELEISNLRVEPEDPRKEEDIELMVDVTNNGDEALEYTVYFYVDLPCRVWFNESETVTVEPGETETVTITFPAMKSGEYSVEVDGVEVTSLDFEVREGNFLLDTWWLLVMIGFVIGMVIVVPQYEKKQRDKK